MKSEMYTDGDCRLAGLAKALGHPVRVAIVRTLVEKSRCPHGCDPCLCGDRCEGENCRCGCKCGDLAARFPMAQSTVSRHIKELKSAGLVRVDGRKGDYTLDHERLAEGLRSLQDLLGRNL